jgi:maleylpyruvate isomerase
MNNPVVLPQFDEAVLATQRYLHALTVLRDEDIGGPSGLPGWTRAHVIGHLARNAEAIAQMLRRVQAGDDAYMYASDQSRDADIEATALLDPAALREDCVSACASLAEAAAALDPDRFDTPVSRTPGAPAFPVSRVGAMRRTEIEIHHADLDVGYSARDWPVDFTVALIERRQDELAAGPPMVLLSTDVDGLWKVGAGGRPEIKGTAADLAWWLVGRGAGDGLVCSAGELPKLTRWR